ncbi:LAMI_0D12486g1_1 [Lachancea mirantina]|uniref:LAMI_0D12486g1_1 n=1 Tax=Lachancea mirantina TaxID=1230905 RepID=A0A1G4JFQ7_9SACH|nr:LAMI_0D12486g1_1 [Lachancea mirantina]
MPELRHATRSGPERNEYLGPNWPTSVASTSFVPSRKLDEQQSLVPILQQQRQRIKRSGTTKSVNSIKHEIHNVQQTLTKLQKNKDDIQKVKSSTTDEIYPGNYSKDHLQRHSLALQTSNELRGIEKQIKRSSVLLSALRHKLDDANVTAEDNARSFHGSEVGESEEKIPNLVSYNSSEPDLADDGLDHGSLWNSNSTMSSGSDFEVGNTSEALLEKSQNEGKEHATWLVSEFLQSLQDKNSTAEFLLGKANDLVALLQKNPGIKYELILSAFSSTIQQLLLSSDDIIVAAGYRICRHLITGKEYIRELIKLRITSFLIISLAKDSASLIEREQAMKLIRSFLDYKEGISKGIVRAIISCIDNSDDKLRDIAIETLLEMCYVMPKLVEECKGIRVLEGFIAENISSPLTGPLLDALLDLMSFEDTRKLLVNFDITVLLTTFAEYQNKSNMNIDKLQKSSQLICKCLKNYNGLVLFVAEDFKAFRQVITFFQIPSICRFLADIILDVLRVKILPYHEQNKGTVSKNTSSRFHYELPPINQYVGLLVKILANLGIIDSLIPVLSSTDSLKQSGLAGKIRYLISEFCNLAMNLVGFNPLTSFSIKPITEAGQEHVISDIFYFERLTNKLNRHRNTIGMGGFTSANDIMEFTEKLRHNFLVNEVDETKFKKMVYDSRVLQTKDFTTWNWNTLSELIEGPLRNSKRIDALMRTTKFFRRLMVFYRPMRYRFSKVKNGSRFAQRYIQVGCQFFKMLISTQEGIRILHDDTKLIPQIASLLYRAMEGQTTNNVLTEPNFSQSVCPGYLKILGVLTEAQSGIELLEKWNIFTVIYKMFQKRSSIGKTYLLQILPELDLTFSLHCRTILGKALVHEDEEIRIAATNALGLSLQKFSSESSRLQFTLLEMLVRQLYDLSPDVIGAADKTLYEFCASQKWPKMIAYPRRHLLHQLVFIKSPLLFEFLQTPTGFRQLDEIQFIQVERNKWFTRKNLEYVSKVEAFIQKEMVYVEFVNDGSERAKSMPLHFYGSLAHTEEGVALITQMGDLVAFANIVKAHRADMKLAMMPEKLLQLKAALWCCGLIGSTDLGIALLDNYTIVEDIIELAYSALATDVKFTAFYVLGLVSKTKEGCEILDELHWDCCLNVLNLPTGLTYPMDVKKFLGSNSSGSQDLKNVGNGKSAEVDLMTGEDIVLDLDKLLSLKAESESTRRDANEDLQAEMERFKIDAQLNSISNSKSDYNELTERILRAASKLNNSILSNGAAKEITDLRTAYGSARVATPQMFTRIVELLEQYRFKPPARKFLCELFMSKKTLETMIRKDRKRRKA